MQRTVAIRLKIPDNEAYTAMAALRRLGLTLDNVERDDILLLEDGRDAASLPDRVKHDETLFNPNKHELRLLDAGRPREGEAWIAALNAPPLVHRIPGVGSALRYTGWRLFCEGKAVAPEVVRAAVERLLCNPAIESAVVR